MTPITNIIVDAMKAEQPGASAEQIASMNRIAIAISSTVIAIVQTATINYIGGLANSGGAVVGVFGGNIT